MGVAGDVGEQVEGHLLAAAGQQHEDALGLLDRRPAGHGGPELLDLGLQRPPPARSGEAAAVAVTSMTIPSTALTPPVGSSSGSPSRTTVRSSPSARTMRVFRAKSSPEAHAAEMASSRRASASGWAEPGASAPTARHRADRSGPSEVRRSSSAVRRLVSRLLFPRSDQRQDHSITLGVGR